MYEKLIAELRQHHCDAREDDTQEVCEECAYDVIIADKSVPSGIASVCVCGLMHRAADAIEELQKQRDEWESHAALAESFAWGWIPVTERLPDDRRDVQITVFWHDAWRTMYGYYDGAFWHLYAPMHTEVADVEVIGWMEKPAPMPLPESLKEDKL